MSSQAAYELNIDAGSSTLKVAGAMTFATAASLYPEAQRIVQSQAVECLDLEAVETADSAGLACVLALKALRHARGCALKVLGAPDGLRSLAQVSDTLAWLPETAQAG